MPFFLKVLAAPDKSHLGGTIPLEEGANLLGRVSPPCSIQLEGAKVSKKHCTFHVVGDRLSVEDHMSSNGVYVNGAKITNVELKLKDRIVIGEYTLEVGK
jgi:pSer/pThr/pTyr-binding forkhead associated (FHA) protein